MDKNLALKSSHIFSDHLSDSFSGIILVSFDKIQEILLESAITSDLLLQIQASYDYYDMGDSYIFPGLIDMNVHLNSNYEDKWSNPSEVTRMASQGGITTIIDNPLMNFYDDKFDEQNCIKNRIENLEGKLYVDCGLMGHLGAHNYKKIKEIYEKGDVLGFKLYLSQTMLSDLPNIERKCLKSLFKKIAKHNELHGIFLAFDCVYVSPRERFMCSPLRGEEKEMRFDLTAELKKFKNFAGGVHEAIQTANERSDKTYSSDEEIEEIIKEFEIHHTEHEDFFSEIDRLKKKANIVAKSQKENAIASLELVQYSTSFRINVLEKEYNEIKEEKKVDISVSTDKELMNDIELSDEDFDNSTTALRKINDKLDPSPNTNNEIEFKSSQPQKLIFFNEEIQNATESKFDGNPLKNCIRQIFEKLSKNTGKTSNNDVQTKKSSHLKVRFPLEIEEEKTPKIISSKTKEVGRPFLMRSKLLSRRITVPNQNNLGKKNLQTMIFKELKELQVEKDEDQEKEEVNNRDYNIFLANHSLIWEYNGIHLIFRNIKSLKNVTMLFTNLSSMSLFFMVKFFNDRIDPKENVHLYTEVCTPYLYFHSKMIKPSYAKFKNSPPIRIKEERDLMIQGLKFNNLIDVVSSFHMSIPPEYKMIDKGNFRRCFNGLSCIGVNLQVVWTKLYVREKKINAHKEGENDEICKYDGIFKEIIRKLCVNPAKILGFELKKGAIKKGFQADFVVWNPFKIITIDKKTIKLASPKLFLFNNRKLYGEVTHTYLRGKLIYKIGEEINVKNGKIMKRL